MCGRYIQVKNIEIIEERFNVNVPEGITLTPNYNVAPGDYAPVITSDSPSEVQLMQFGLTPFWAKKPMYLFNARAEGDRNKENNPNYTGGKDIINKPSFRKPIRSQRCLVIADAFYEGSTKERLNNPYLVFLKGKQGPFAFAGIWDTWMNPETKEKINSFAIITTTTNSLLQKIPHHRSPVILPRNREQSWINNSKPLTDITRMLQPLPGELMNAYPISTQMKNARNKGKELIAPTGKALDLDTTYKGSTSLELHGMGHYKRK